MTVQQSKAQTSRKPASRAGPLAGVRIADFTWVAAGPLATRFLADMGAEVIKIEDGRPGHPRIDRIRRVTITRGTSAKSVGHDYGDFNLNSSGMFNNYNRSKLSVTIDMTSPRGRAVAEQLIAQCSVVTENFAPGVMEQWGLTYERLDEISPEIIFARMSGFGHSGPHEMFRSYGPVVQAVCGLSHISGLSGGAMPSGWGLSYMDNQAGYQGANAVLAALYRRNETGKGTLIDLSAVEAGISLIGPKMLDVTVNGARTRGGDFPCGNRLPDNAAAPHGIYPTIGTDKWIAIAVMDDNQWVALRQFMDADWATDPRFDTAGQRCAAQDELDELMGVWTAEWDKHELTAMLQQSGVPAMAVQDEADKERDPQLNARGLYPVLDHAVCGPSRFEGTPIKFSRSRPDLWRSAPLVGEDNDYVFREVIGMDAAQIADLKQAGDHLMERDTRPYARLKAIELSEDAAGEMTGKYLADLGAEVIKVEPPAGAASRRVGPYAGGREDGEHSLHFWFYNPGKSSVTLNLERADGMAALRVMLTDADLLIVGYQPARLEALGLDYEELQRSFPKLILVSVTPYGLTGPWADYCSTDLIALAGGGQLNVSGYDDHSIPPIRPGGNQGYHIAASFAVAGAEIALLQRQADGSGQLVDVSMHESCAITVELAFAYWEYQKAPMLRQTCRHAQPLMTHCALFECADGRYVYAVIMLAEPKPWTALVGWMEEEGMALDLTEERFFNAKYRQENFGYVSQIVECFFLTKTAEEAYRQGQAREIPIGMLYAPEELIDDPHLTVRGFWRDTDGTDGTIRYPGAPFVFSGFAIPPAARPPRLGEHNHLLRPDHLPLAG